MQDKHLKNYNQYRKCVAAELICSGQG